MQRDSSAALTRLQDDLATAKLELDHLYAALDNVDSGLLILDRDLQVIYSNPILHTIFKSSFTNDSIRQTRPPYVDLLRSAAASLAVDLENYVERRLAWVTSGDPKPMDLPMTDGSVLRCRVAALPGGGRMLVYSDVTDIVRNAQEMERLATTDGMTGIYNRRHFFTLADHEWARARRYGRPLAFLMIDIDHFKSINDKFGHSVGDDVIVRLAKLARELKRDSDVLARIGGEEFALLLPETDLKQAEVVAERLRSEVASAPFVASQNLATTISVGCACASLEMADIADLMKAADVALYEAKQVGRNRVVCWAPAGASPPLSPAAESDASVLLQK